jgi:6-phosphogluconolactonase
LYVGCYTNESPVGIRVYDASDPGGLLTLESEVDDIEHASFLALHPDGSVLYAVSETVSPDGGAVVAYRVDPTDGSLTMIDRTSSQGSAPCYVSVDASGRHLYVANYVSGSITVLALGLDGRFGDLVATNQHRGSGPTSRQEGPHPHCILPGPGGASVYVADLGTDRVLRYLHLADPGDGSFEPDDELVLAAGSGPRHLAFHPEQPVAFLVCELDSTIATLGVDPKTGRLAELGIRSTLPDDFDGFSIGAEVSVHPNGHHVYVSNRGHDSLAVFGFSEAGEPLELLGHIPSGGRTPRNFAVHPSGSALLVANQDSNSLIPFMIDPATGMPTQLDASYGASEPVCLTYLEVER